VTEVRRLVAGRLSASFVGTELRDIAIDENAVLDRLYFAVRDPDWVTLPLPIHDVEVRESAEGFRITIDGTCEGAVPLVFTVRYEATSTSLVAELRYRAMSDCMVNRVGFCLLHPMEFAGTPADIADAAGESVGSTFPDRISASSPFTDITGMTLRVGATAVDIAFAGDLFEMEDQRNWIDASYKTFSTPLSHAHPRPLAAGGTREQVVALRWRRTDPASSPAQSPMPTQSPSPAPVQSPTPAQSPPPLAAPPLVGLGASTSPSPMRAADARQLQSLRPAWLAVTLLIEQDWTARWARAVEEARALGVALDVTLVVASPSAIDGWRPLQPAPVMRLQAYDSTSDVTTAELAVAVRRLRDRWEGNSTVRVAGGSRANFAELNRASERLPLDLLDEVVFAANPQVHAFDDRSILQTPAALAVAVRDAQQIARGKPVLVAPLTLAPTYNAAATGPRRLDELPADPRQHRELVGGWTRQVLDAVRGTAGVTVFQTRGAWGVLDSTGRRSPAYDALASVRPAAPTGRPPPRSTA